VRSVNAKSVLLGIIAAAAIGFVVHALALPDLLALAVGAAAGALMRHEEDSQTAAIGFLASAAVLLAPLGGLEIPIGLALFGYTAARHT